MTPKHRSSASWSSVAATLAEEALRSDDSANLLERLLCGLQGIYGLRGALFAQDLDRSDGFDPKAHVGSPDNQTGNEVKRWRDRLSSYVRAPDESHDVEMLALSGCRADDKPTLLLLAGVGSPPRPALLVDARDALRLAGVIAEAIEQREDGRLSRHRLHSIIDATGAGTWEWEVQTGRARMNHRWAEICGLTLKELGSTHLDTWSSIVHPDDLPHCILQLEAHLAGKTERYDATYRVKHESGRWVWVQDRGQVVRFTADGRPSLMVGSHTDISELRNYEAMLEVSNAALRRHAVLLDSAGRLARFGGWEYEVGGTSETWNDGVCSIFAVESGFQPTLAEALAFYSDASRPLIAAAVESCIAHGTPFDLEAQIITARGQPRWVRVQGEREVQDGQATRIFGALQDITERRTMQDALVTSNLDLEARVTERTRDLEAAKRYAEEASRAKDEFLTNISHELRSPLHSVLGFTELALEDLESTDPATLRRFIERSRSSASQLLKLVNDLLDAAKIESGRLKIQPDVCRLDAIAEEVISEFEVASKNKLLSIERQDHREVIVHADSARLAQAIRNVMANAIRFSPQGGRVSVSIAQSANGAVQLTISDEGPGIPEDELESIFDRFTQSSRTKSGAGGTGLGLPIARGIVDLHGGRLWATRGPKGGTAFCLELPIA